VSLGDRAALARDVALAPRVTIDLWGGAFAREAYEGLVAPHPRFRVVGRKTWGVALLPVDPGYLRGGQRQTVRRQRNRALRAGHRYERFHAPDRIGEILAVNRSAPVRQAHAMRRSYTDERAVHAHAERFPDLHGVFGPDGRLAAYAFVPVIGDAALLNRVLGDAGRLDEGVMYLLVAEVVAALAAGGAGRPPSWLMYDMFWGAAPGLAEFKRRLGFRPHRVRWRWSGDGGG
jgi:hypothetical protein